MSCPQVIEVVTSGPPGPGGPTGPAGVGAAWRQGAGVPGSGTGSLGDFYLNTSNGDIYGPKTSGGWGSVIFNIAQGQTGPQGPTGATGATGPAGTAGRTVLSGSGAPGSGTGANGDFFIDTTGWVIYGPKANGVWPGGASLIGPAGATGPQGPTGPTGPAGTPAAYSDATPQPLGTATAGTAQSAARADHVHALPTPAAIDAVSGSDSRLSDAREWSADTITQVEAEAGIGTTRRAFTATRVFQAIAAWWTGSSAATKLAGIQAGATANATDAQLRDRSTHTGTQSASTISDSTTAGRALLTAADASAQRTTLGLAGFATADPAAPPAIGGTTPAAGSFTRLSLPAQGSAPSTPASGFSLYAGSGNALSWVGANGFVRVFDGTANTANRTYTLPDASGTLALAGDAISATTTRAANQILAGPASGSAAAPTFRALVAADLPVATWSLRQTVTAASSVFTLDVTAANEFITNAAIAGNVTINLSNLTSIPSGYVWRGVLRFAYTSGTITWFSGNSGYTVKWDGGSAITPTAGEQEAVIIEVVGGGTVIEVAALRGRA